MRLFASAAIVAGLLALAPIRTGHAGIVVHANIRSMVTASMVPAEGVVSLTSNVPLSVYTTAMPGDAADGGGGRSIVMPSALGRTVNISCVQCTVNLKEDGAEGQMITFVPASI
jgi:hypothetical protein